MNLVSDSWIPVIFQNGDTRKVSLLEVFKQGEGIRDLAVNPVQRISLMRLLICITQTALDGPEDEEEWVGCRDKMAEASIRYLEEKKDRFDLYGRSAFLQIPELEPIQNAVVDKLDFGLASGNNANLFDHEATPEGRERESAWCALMVLAYQCFSPGGLVGVAKWGNRATSKTSQHAPCVEGSALHVLIRKDNVVATIHANLLTKEQVATLPDVQSKWGKPIWELDAIDAKSLGAEIATHSYLGRLLPLSRAICLEEVSRNFSLANGLAYAKLPAARETTATVIIRGKGDKAKEGYIHVSLTRHPWRELGSIISLKQTGLAGGPLALQHLRPTNAIVDIWAGGMAADKGKILDVAEWNLAIPTNLLNEPELKTYEDGVGLAQIAEFLLGNAVQTYCKEQKADNTLLAKGKLHYWSSLDNHYQLLIDAATDINLTLNDTWHPIVRDTMKKAYAFACPHETPRQIQSYAQGFQKLHLKKLDE